MIHKSKTVWFNMFMAAIETTHASIYLMEPVLTSEQFAYVSMALGIIHGVGGVYLRTITTQPLSEK